MLSRITPMHSEAESLYPIVPGLTNQTYPFCRDDATTAPVPWDHKYDSSFWRAMPERRFRRGRSCNWYYICNMKRSVRKTTWAVIDQGRFPHLAFASVRSTVSLQFVSQRERNFGATHGIYRRTALKRCQRKGNRPRGGFRLSLGAVSGECLGWLGSGVKPEFVRRSDRGPTTNNSQCSSRF